MLTQLQVFCLILQPIRNHLQGFAERCLPFPGQHKNIGLFVFNVYLVYCIRLKLNEFCSFYVHNMIKNTIFIALKALKKN